MNDTHSGNRGKRRCISSSLMPVNIYVGVLYIWTGISATGASLITFVLKIKNEYSFLGLFVVFALLLYLLGREIASAVYESYHSDNFIEKLSYAITVSQKFHEIFLACLLLISGAGVLVTKSRPDRILLKGFRLALLFSLGLLLAYLAMMYA